MHIGQSVQILRSLRPGETISKRYWGVRVYIYEGGKGEGGGGRDEGGPHRGGTDTNTMGRQGGSKKVPQAIGTGTPKGRADAPARAKSVSATNQQLR